MTPFAQGIASASGRCLPPGNAALRRITPRVARFQDPTLKEKRESY